MSTKRYLSDEENDDDAKRVAMGDENAWDDDDFDELMEKVDQRETASSSTAPLRSKKTGHWSRVESKKDVKADHKLLSRHITSLIRAFRMIGAFDQQYYLAVMKDWDNVMRLKGLATKWIRDARATAGPQQPLWRKWQGIAGLWKMEAVKYLSNHLSPIVNELRIYMTDLREAMHDTMDVHTTNVDTVATIEPMEEFQIEYPHYDVQTGVYSKEVMHVWIPISKAVELFEILNKK